MNNAASKNSTKVNAHRNRLREQGLRPVQIWVPDVRTQQFKDEARQQSLAANASTEADDDQAFVDSISEFDNE